jgi:hypothetical protein
MFYKAIYSGIDILLRVFVPWLQQSRVGLYSLLALPQAF